jgi:DGQHR domain-containing protein
MPDTTAPFIELKQHDRVFLVTRLPAGLLSRISYASVRRVDQEEGAVQRVLNTRRIAAIKDFTLAGGDYPNSIVLNWVSRISPLLRNGNMLTVPDVARSAQLIDGQHRVAGLSAALEERAELADLPLPVAIYEGLDTRECANIFLAINTEQKPVARSLVFDLYGVASDQIVDPAATRARDIAMLLHEDTTSPYYDLIKLPGAQRKRGGIPLSTAVSAIKVLVEDKGDFYQVGITELESQEQIFMNYFTALSSKYNDQWDERSNVFMYAAGFTAAVDFLRRKMIPYCVVKRSFATDTIKDAFDFDSQNLILQEEVRGKGGTEAVRLIYDRLNASFDPEQESEQVFRM